MLKKPKLTAMDNDKMKSIEEYIDFLEESFKDGGQNLPEKEIVSDYKQKVESVSYSLYIDRADLHYFISRQLFLVHIDLYSYFAGHQCIENYLKAYIKYKNSIPKDIHILEKLLENCRQLDIDKNDNFIHSARITTIIKFYEPFYELARYPVQKVRPNKGQYVSVFPDGINILDLFVFRMREIIKLPENSRDLFKDNHYHLDLCQMKDSSFYNKFKKDNINFQ